MARRKRVTAHPRHRKHVDEDLLIRALVLMAEEIARRNHPDNS